MTIMCAHIYVIIKRGLAIGRVACAHTRACHTIVVGRSQTKANEKTIKKREERSNICVRLRMIISIHRVQFFHFEPKTIPLYNAVGGKRYTM